MKINPVQFNYKVNSHSNFNGINRNTNFNKKHTIETEKDSKRKVLNALLITGGFIAAILTGRFFYKSKLVKDIKNQIVALKDKNQLRICKIDLESIDKPTKDIVDGRNLKRMPIDAIKRAKKILDTMKSADTIDDLIKNNSNGLQFEKLTNSKYGQYSVRVNQQWRICFDYDKAQKAFTNVNFCDYH